MSIFCTNKAHALQFAKFALRVRQKVDHGIKFKTTPQSAMHLEPGQYFRYYSEATHTDRFANGVITDDGTIQSQVELLPGSEHNIYYWKPSDNNIKAVIDRKSGDISLHKVLTIVDIPQNFETEIEEINQPATKIVCIQFSDQRNCQ